MSIPNHILDQLNSQADLVSIIGRHTTLKKAGNEYKGCCPFHGEKTPSFYVNPQKNMYHCFGCGVGGNALSFLRDYENLTFVEATKELSRQTGIEIPEDKNKKHLVYKRNTKHINAPYPPVNTTNPQANRSPVNHQTHPTQANHQQGSPNLHRQNNQANAHSQTQPQPQFHSQAQPQNWQTQVAPNTGFNKQTHANAQPHLSGNHCNHSADGTSNHLASHTNTNHHPNHPDSIIGQSFTDDSYGYAADTSHFDAYDVGIPATGFASNASHVHTNDADTNNEGNLYDLLTNIHQFYQSCLQNTPKAKAYFESRGLSNNIIKTFGLGYAPSGWQHLEKQFPQDIEGLKLLGLVRTSDSGRDYDLLRDRVIFVIKDSQGRVIGFAGRALDNEVKPKYINSSDSPVFHKQHVLYGYYESRQQRANDWLVVEGYMDVIALYQAGIYGAVASMGTAVNESQLSRLLTLNPVLTLSFDGDAAGQKAAWRTLEVSLPIMSDDKELRFLTLPDNHDPDTYIKEHGADAMQTQIQQATPLSQYIYAYLSNQHDLTLAEGKAKLMAQVRALTNQLPKGSSFRYLLNNDIYQKLNGRDKGKNLNYQSINAQNLLIDFSSKFTSSVNLCLCLLYQPNLLASNPIEHIYQQAGLNELKLPTHIHQKLQAAAINIPKLPSWQDLNNPHLFAIVRSISQLATHLPNDINIASHYLLASLPTASQAHLAPHWQGFYHDLLERNVIDVEPVFIELLISQLCHVLQTQSQSNDDSLIREILNKRRTKLVRWQKHSRSQV